MIAITVIRKSYGMLQREARNNGGEINNDVFENDASIRRIGCRTQEMKRKQILCSGRKYARREELIWKVKLYRFEVFSK